MKTFKLLLIIFILMGSGHLHAQKEKSLKWEVGTDLLYLIGKNQFPDYSLFLRWHYKPLHAWRIRVGTDFRNNPERINAKKIEKTDFLIRVGHEWSKNIAKNTRIFWGLDMSYQKNEIEAWLLPTPQAPPFYFPDYDWQLGFVGLIGCKYALSPNFSISVESNLNFFYREHSVNNYFFGSATPTSGGLLLGGGLIFNHQNSVNAMGIEVQPLQVFNFSYHF